MSNEYREEFTSATETLLGAWLGYYMVMQDQLLAGELINYDCYLEDTGSLMIEDIAACVVIGNTRHLEHCKKLAPYTTNWLMNPGLFKTAYMYLINTIAGNDLALFVISQAIYGPNKLVNKVVELWSALMTFKHGTPAGLLFKSTGFSVHTKFAPSTWILKGRV